MTETEFLAELRKPATTPNPVPKDRVDEHRHEEGVQNERTPLPTLSHRARRNRRGGIHKDHRKKEQTKHTHVVGVAAEKETLRAEETKGVTGDRDRVFRSEWTSVTQCRDYADATHLQSVAQRPVPAQTDAIAHHLY